MARQTERWEAVYREGSAAVHSWYRAHLEVSLELIERAAPERSAAIVDAGGGASTLVDDLVERGYRQVTVLDVAPAALAEAQRRLGTGAAGVRWLAADLLECPGALAPGSYQVWHDRAVFHFLTAPRERRAYVAAAARALRPGGYVVMATFAPEGPERCSGLPVARYEAVGLAREFGDGFQLVGESQETHITPVGREQVFTYCVLRKSGGSDA